MCCSLNLYKKYIYAEYFMTYLLSAFKRLECPHCFTAWWGWSQQDEAVSPSPSMLTPYPPRHASTTTWRGWCGGGWGRSSVRLWWVWSGRLPPPLYWSFASALLSLWAEAKPQPPPVAAHLWLRESSSQPHWHERSPPDFLSWVRWSCAPPPPARKRQIDGYEKQTARVK